MNEIVFHAERETVDAGSAVMVVIQRALVIMVMTVVIMGMSAATVVLVGVNRMGGFVSRKYARVQPGKDAKDHQPCEKVTHAWNLR